MIISWFIYAVRVEQGIDRDVLAVYRAIFSIASMIWRMRNVHSRSGDTQRLGKDHGTKRRKDGVAENDVNLRSIQNS